MQERVVFLQSVVRRVSTCIYGPYATDPFRTIELKVATRNSQAAARPAFTPLKRRRRLKPRGDGSTPCLVGITVKPYGVHSTKKRPVLTKKFLGYRNTLRSFQMRQVLSLLAVMIVSPS